MSFKTEKVPGKLVSRCGKPGLDGARGGGLLLGRTGPACLSLSGTSALQPPGSGNGVSLLRDEVSFSLASVLRVPLVTSTVQELVHLEPWHFLRTTWPHFTGTVSSRGWGPRACPSKLRIQTREAAESKEVGSEGLKDI